MKTIINIFLSLFIILSCEPDTEKQSLHISDDVIFLGHKGSGGKNHFGNKFHSNSVDGVFNAINMLEGSEFDLQLSADTTIWLFHDHEITNCKEKNVNFSTLTDEEIEAINKSQYNGSLITLHKLVQKLKSENVSNKTISLDLKLLQNPYNLKKFGNNSLTNTTIKLLTEIFKEVKDVSVLAEVPGQSQYDLFIKNSSFTPYLVEVNYNYLTSSPSSYNYSSPIHHLKDESIAEKLRSRKGKLQLWVVNSADDFFTAMRVNPNYIQSDNIPMLSFFSKLKENYHQKLEKSISSISTNDEFIPILNFETESKPETLFEFSINHNIHDSLELHLVFSGEDEDGENTFWEKTDFNRKKHYFYFNNRFNNDLNSSKVKVYILNSNKHKIELKNIRVNSFTLP